MDDAALTASVARDVRKEVDALNSHDLRLLKSMEDEVRGRAEFQGDTGVDADGREATNPHEALEAALQELQWKT